MNLNELVQSVAAGVAHAARKPNIYNYIPNPGGQDNFHKSDATGRLLAGDNRSGKTVGGAVEAIWWLTGTHPYLKTPKPPVYGRVVTVDFEYGADQIIVPKLKQWIPASVLINNSWDDSYNAKKHLLKLRNGSELEIKAHGQKLDSFAGVSRHFVWFDEEPPRAIYVESKTRLLDFNGKFWITMTPVEGLTWVYDDLVEGDPKNVKLFEIDVKDNRYISAESLKTLSEDLDEEERKIRLGGGKNFVPRGGLVFKEFNYDKHVIRPGLPPESWEIWASVDPGFNNPTAWLWHGISPDGLTIITFAEHYRSEWTAQLHAQRVHAMNKEMGRFPVVYTGDPSMSQRSNQTGHSLLVEYAKYGINIKPSKKNTDNAGIDRMNDYLRTDRWLITQNCPNLIRELRKLPWKRYQSPKIADLNNKREEPLDKDNHATDSAEYFFRFRPDITSEEKIREKVSLVIPSPDNPKYPWRVDRSIIVPASGDLGWGEVD